MSNIQPQSKSEFKRITAQLIAKLDYFIARCSIWKRAAKNKRKLLLDVIDFDEVVAERLHNIESIAHTRMQQLKIYKTKAARRKEQNNQPPQPALC